MSPLINYLYIQNKNCFIAVSSFYCEPEMSPVFLQSILQNALSPGETTTGCEYENALPSVSRQ